MSQQLLYRYDYLYHLYRSSFRAARRFATIGGFGDSSRRRSSSSTSSSRCFLRLFVRYLLLQQLLQWVFCGNGSVSGNCCGPYIGMVASWTIGTAVLNHPRRRISTATKRSSIPSSSPLTQTTRTFQSSPLSLYRSDGVNSSSTAVVVVAGAEMDIPTTTAATTTTINPATADSDATNATASQGAKVMANVHRLPLVHRVHCISDLHVDNPDNLRWLESRCRPRNATTTKVTSKATSTSDATSNTTNQDNRNRNIRENARRERRVDWDETDMIVVAGDISHQMDRIEHSLLLLKQTGAEVLFVPGNHEAWLAVSSTTPTKSNYSSLSKLEDIETLCRKLGVYTTGDCVCVGGVAPNDASSETEIGPLPSTATTTTPVTTIPTTTEELWILPLDSWYDGSLSFVDLNGAPPNNINNNNNDDNTNITGKSEGDPVSSVAPPPYYDLVRDFGKWPWVDFQQCQWPSRLFQESSTGNESSTDHWNGNRKSPNGVNENENESEQPPHQVPTPPQRSKLLKKIPAGLVDYYLERNQPVIDAFHEQITSSSPEMLHTNNTNTNTKRKISVLTVTHFLPNQQSLPDWKDLDSRIFRCDSWLDHGAGGMSAKFALVGGSDKIDAQIRSLSAIGTGGVGGAAFAFHRQMHVFGHSHRPKDFVYKGIRYVHNPLGKPREREMHMVDPEVEIKLLWQTSDDDETTGRGHGGSIETILRYWEERGGGLEMLLKRMEAGKRNRKLRRSRQRKP